jgi:hypothetical protein
MIKVLYRLLSLLAGDHGEHDNGGKGQRPRPRRA